MPGNLQSDVISVGVSIGRGIFQHYFTPTAFKRFDKDHKIGDIIKGLFGDYPEALSVLEKKGPEIQEKISKGNALNVLLGKPRVDFEGFISTELGGEDSEVFQMFQVFLDRMEQYEREEKERVFDLIASEEGLSEDDYLFVMELFTYERCNFQEFNKLYKFIRNIQYEGHLIISSLEAMKNEEYKKGFMQLIEEKGTDDEKDALSGFM